MTFRLPEEASVASASTLSAETIATRKKACTAFIHICNEIQSVLLVNHEFYICLCTSNTLIFLYSAAHLGQTSADGGAAAATGSTSWGWKIPSHGSPCCCQVFHLKLSQLLFALFTFTYFLVHSNGYKNLQQQESFISTLLTQSIEEWTSPMLTGILSDLQSLMQFLGKYRLPYLVK